MYKWCRFALLILSFALAANTGVAQDSVQVKPAITITGFADVYYALDFNQLTSVRNIPYAYNHSRHNEFAINLALLQAHITTDDYRATLGLQAGTYPLTNYAAEPDHFRHLHNANAGIRLGGKFWLDAGIWGSSHIGFESAISTENWTLTRSLSAENSPYYETGARLAYESENLTMALLVLNGWQNIVDNNGNKALGTQIAYSPSDKLLLNHSTFYGNEGNGNRLFQNFHVIWKPTGRLGIILGSDFGMEEALLPNADSTGWNKWFAETLIVRHQFARKWAVAARAEFYSDRNNVILSTPPKEFTSGSRPFQVGGFSLNLDYSPRKEVMVRIEGRNLISDRKVFASGGRFTDNRPTLTTSLAVSF